MSDTSDTTPATDEHGEPKPVPKREPCERWMAVACVLLLVVVAPLMLWDTLHPDRIARHERLKQEAHQRAVDSLRRHAMESLPPGAVEVTVTKDEYPTGWLTFVRMEDGKRVKYLAHYHHNGYTGEYRFTPVRAD